MALKRIINTGFWQDEKVIDLFSPEDKLFFLYLLTNPHSTLLGIYQINKKVIAFELGYSIETINTLIDRFENKYQIIKYSNETNEIAIKNYLRHSINKGGKPIEDCLKKDINDVKDLSLLEYVYLNIKKYSNLNETINNIVNNDIYNILYNNNTYTNNHSHRHSVSYHDTCNDTCNDTSIDELFNSLWEIYPKKLYRQKALDEFKKINPSKELANKMITQVEKFKDSYDWQLEFGKYIPNLANWLIDRRWEDEVETETEKNDRILKEWEEKYGKE